MATLDSSLVSQLFRVADEDHDGAVGGAEAVKFFSRAGLPQETLVQVIFYHCLSYYIRPVYVDRCPLIMSQRWNL